MFSFTDIPTYHQQLLQKETTCVSVVEHYIAQIRANTILNAFVEVYEAEALQTAARLDEARKNGATLKKLHGVVIAIKDVICYKDHRVSAASGILQHFTSLYTSTALQLLIEEDAIIIGNTNCDEFAMGSSNENSYYGNVLNAKDHTRVPGGSSGGSAVAVQADMCMVSLGSDTGGSVRQPADFCGIIGFKPGYGTFSRYGLIAYASSFDQIGIFGKTVSDIQLLLEIMAQTDVMDSTMHQTSLPPANKKEKYAFAYYRQMLEHPALDPEIKAAFENTLQALIQHGHSVKAIEFDFMEYIVPTYYVLTTAEASSNLSRYDGIRYGHQSTKTAENIFDFYCNNRSEGFGKEVKRRIMLGSFVLSAGFYDAYFNKALQVRRLLFNQVNELFQSHDAILSPVSPTTAFPIGEKTKDPTTMYIADIYTVYANLTGIAGISLPLFLHSNGMPFGLQVMSRNRDELTLLEISQLLIRSI